MILSGSNCRRFLKVIFWRNLVRGIYLSIFPFERSAEIMNGINVGEWRIRKALGTRIRNQLKSVPELSFFLDDSLEYIENIDNLLK